MRREQTVLTSRDSQSSMGVAYSARDTHSGTEKLGITATRKSPRQDF
jgi:hypothetical protein